MMIKADEIKLIKIIMILSYTVVTSHSKNDLFFQLHYENRKVFVFSFKLASIKQDM